ncbi:MAG: hypothetical protein WC838_02120, partial [Candidatus Margulisiibacteriota bacterium]
MRTTNQVLIRILTTVVAGIPIIACTVLGGVFFLILMIILTMLSINEFYYMAQGKTQHYGTGVLVNGLAAALVSVSFFMETHYIWHNIFMAICTCLLVGVWISELYIKKLLLL